MATTPRKTKAEKEAEHAAREAETKRRLAEFRETVLKPELMRLMVEVTEMGAKGMKCEAEMFYSYETAWLGNERVAEGVSVRFKFDTNRYDDDADRDATVIVLATGAQWELDALVERIKCVREEYAKELRRKEVASEAKALLSDEQLEALGLKR